jgi:hypothetical protein
MVRLDRAAPAAHFHPRISNDKSAPGGALSGATIAPMTRMPGER